MTIGRMLWAIPEGYLPSSSTSSDRTLVSHEAACILNASDRPANIAITLFFWILRSILRADRTERRAYARIEAEQRAKRGLPAPDAAQTTDATP